MNCFCYLWLPCFFFFWFFSLRTITFLWIFCTFLSKRLLEYICSSLSYKFLNYELLEIEYILTIGAGPRNCFLLIYFSLCGSVTRFVKLSLQKTKQKNQKQNLHCRLNHFYITNWIDNKCLKVISQNKPVFFLPFSFDFKLWVLVQTCSLYLKVGDIAKMYELITVKINDFFLKKRVQINSSCNNSKYLIKLIK